MKTAGEPAKIHLIPDQKKICVDGRDLCNVEIQIVDKNGTLVPSAEHEIQFKIQGPGKIIGVDNGDITSLEPFKVDKRKAFHGRALLVVQSERKTGKITLKAQADGLPTATLKINVR